MWTSYSNPTLTDVTFSGNSGTNGGGVRSYHSSPMLVNVAFILNRATNYGGGLYIEYWSVPTLVNVTIAGNTAARGGGIETHRSTITVTNTIVWGNSPMLDQFYKASGWPVVSYSDIQEGCPGGTTCTQVIDSDPLFVDAAGGDLRVQPASPAIDAGDNAAVPIGVTTDLLGYPRFVDIASVVDTGNGSPPIVDMGAYEAQIVVYLPILSQ